MMTARAVLSAACILLPLWVWHPRVVGDWRLDGALLSLAVVGVAVTQWRKRLRVLPGTAFFFGALVFGLLPLIFSMQAPWGGLADRAPLFSAWLLMLLVAEPGGFVKRMWPLLVAGIGAASLYGVLQIAGFDPLGFRPEPHSPPVAPFANSNVAAEVVAPFLIATLALGLRAKWVLVLCALSAFHLGFLGVTAARLSLPLGVLFCVWRGRGQGGQDDEARRASTPWLPAAVIALAFIAGEAGRGVVPQPQDPRADQAPEAPADLGSFPTFQVRWLMATAGLKKAALTPLGIGLGRFETSYPFWRSEEELRLSSRGYTDPAVPRPATLHNEPLLGWLETGYLGALCLAVAVFRMLRRRTRAAWTTPALLAFGVHCLVRAPLTHNPAALALGALLLAAGRDDSQTDDGPSAWFPGRLVLLLALLPLVAAPSQIFGELALADRFGTDDPAAQLNASERAVNWRQWDALAWNFLAIDRSTNDPTDVLGVREALLSAIEQDPGNLKALTTLVKLEMVQDNELAGLEWLILAERVAPKHPSVSEARTLYLEEQARRMRNRGMQLLQGRNPAYKSWLVAGNVIDALVAARRNDLDEARRELLAAAPDAEALQPLLRRTAAREDLGVALLRDVAERVILEVAQADPEQSLSGMLGPAKD